MTQEANPVPAVRPIHSGWRFFLSVAVFFAAYYGAAYLADLFHPGSEQAFEAYYRPFMLVILLSGFMLLGRFLDFDADPLRSMGLGTDRRWLRELGMGILSGTAMILLAVMVVRTAGGYSFERLEEGSMTLRALNRTWILLAGALAEEVAFRGYPFQRLVETVRSPIIAVLLLSGLFGVIHLWNPGATVWGFLNTILIGVLLSYAFLWTKSLWLTWGIHFAWNFTLGAVFGLPVSGLDLFQTFVRGQASGPVWLTGGVYGIEASATGTAVILLGWYFLLRSLKRVP